MVGYGGVVDCEGEGRKITRCPINQIHEWKVL